MHDAFAWCTHVSLLDAVSAGTAPTDMQRRAVVYMTVACLHGAFVYVAARDTVSLVALTAAATEAPDSIRARCGVLHHATEPQL